MLRRSSSASLLVVGLCAVAGCTSGDDNTIVPGVDAAIPGFDATGAPDVVSGSQDGASPDATVPEDAGVDAPVDTSVAEDANDGGTPGSSDAGDDAPEASAADANDAAAQDANDASIEDANEAGDDGPADAGIDAADASDATADAGPVVVACPPAPIAAPPTPLSGRVFVATSYSAATEPIYDVTTLDGGPLTTFATVNAGGWLGPMIITTSGKFYVATNAGNGSVYDVSAGGDQTTATPLVSGAFPTGLSYIEGMAVDSAGTFYLTNSETGLQSIAVAKPGSAISYLARQYDNAVSMVVCGGVLVISEGNTGNIVAHDLATGNESTWASGFTAGASHISGQLVVDHRGHLLVMWRTSQGTTGIFDVTAGGDFTAQTPLVAAASSIDVNEIAINAANDVFASGDGSSALYVARFLGGSDAGADGGSPYGAFSQYVAGVGDSESVAVAP